MLLRVDLLSLLYISAEHLSEVGNFLPYDRSNCIQETRAVGQSRATTARREENAPARVPLQHRYKFPACKWLCPLPTSHATVQWTNPSLSGCVWAPPPLPIGLQADPRTFTLLNASLRASGCLDPCCILSVPGLLTLLSSSLRASGCFNPCCILSFPGILFLGALCGLPTSLPTAPA